MSPTIVGIVTGSGQLAVGKKVILRAIPYWLEFGTEKWIEDEEARYFVLNAAIEYSVALQNAINPKQR